MVHGTPIFYEEYGSGVPLLCIHGFPEDHRVLSGCIEPILGAKAGVRRIYIDLPGMGASPVNPLIQSADNMLDAVAAFADQVIGNRAFLLFGQSYGAYLSLGLAFRSIRPVAGLFLLCPCTVADRTARDLPARTIVKRESVAVPRQEEDAFADFLRYAAIATEETWTRYKAEVLPGLACANGGFVTAYQGGGYGFSFENELRSTLRFDGPAHFLTGAMDDCVGYADAYKLLHGFSRGSFTIVEGAGHNLQIEYPHYFDFVFRDWMDRSRRMG